MKAKEIIFSYPLESAVRIAIEDAFKWYDSQDKAWQPTKVIWEDGTESWAKGWWDGSPDTGGNRLVEVGAGACGDTTVLKRQSFWEKEFMNSLEAKGMV